MRCAAVDNIFLLLYINLVAFVDAYRIEPELISIYI